MDPDELEALIGRLGTRSSTSLETIVQRLVEAGPPVFPNLLRVLEDRDYRLALWERYGKMHEGEPILEGYFPAHTLNPVRYDQMLRVNVIYVLSRRRESKAEPLVTTLREAAGQAFKEKYPEGRPDQPDPDSEQGRWEAYLDACSALDLDSVRAFWEGHPEDQNAANAGVGSALMDDRPGVSPSLSKVLEFLLDKGGHIDEELNVNNGSGALQFAAQNDDPERVSWLLAHGADVNKADDDGKTALMYALRGDGRIGPRDMEVRRAVLRALLEAGADPAFQERTQYEDFEFIGPTLWEFVDAEGDALLAEFGIIRPPEDNADAAE